MFARCRRRAEAYALFLLIVTVAACRDAAPRRTPSLQAGSRPHVVLVIIDTLRADHLPSYGYSRQTAPYLQALGARGWVFDRAFAQSGWTLPATGSILSGLLPTEHGGVRDGNDMRRFGRFDPPSPTAAEAFTTMGYRTGAVVNNTFLAPDFGFNRGFASYDYRGADSMQHRSAVDTAAAGLQWLDSAATPAFLMLHFMEPHTSYAAGAPERGLFATLGEEANVPFPFHLQHGKPPFAPRDPGAREIVAALYDEEIHAADRGIGQLVEGLSKRGLIDSTWIIVTSDHGEELWDHGGFEHGHHLMGELLRVPLIVAGPATTHRRIAAPVSHIDIHATLLALSGHAQIDGSGGLDLVRAAQEPGRLPAARPIVAEDCLYGPWRSAVTVGGYRVETNHQSGKTSLFALDAYGQGDRAIATGKDDIRRDLESTMQRLRGGRGAPQVASRALNLDAAKLEQLRALGYLR